MAVVNLDFGDLFEEAYERAGLELRTGYGLKSIRRSFNLMMNDWANKGLNLWSIEEGTVNTVASTATYVLPVDTVDLIDHTIRETSSTTEINLARIAVGTWARRSDKSQEGRPTQIYIERITAPQVTLWPVPDAVYVLRYWRLARLDGLASGLDGAPDIPSRFVEPLVSGLAYNAALKSRDAQALQRLPLLKQLYDEAWQQAADEDRDRASQFITPGRTYQ